MGKKFKCHRIAEGTAEAEIIVSNEDVNFYLISPENGVMIEKVHDIAGKSIAGKIFAFAGGKGSSVVQADGLYQLQLKGNQPRAMIVQYPETVLVSSAIIMEVPTVDKVDEEFYKTVKNGDRVRVDADHEYVEILDGASS